MGKPVESQMVFTFASPSITPRGDGSFFISPGKPIREMTPNQAHKFLGICRTSIYELLECGMLPCRRPLKKKILIPVDALEDYRRKTADPEFWAQGAALNHK